MGNGKEGFAPCGHRGECVIGTYYRCLVGCDDKAVPEPVKPEKTQPIKRNEWDLALCGYCGGFITKGAPSCLHCGWWR